MSSKVERRTVEGAMGIFNDVINNRTLTEELNNGEYIQ